MQINSDAAAAIVKRCPANRDVCRRMVLRSYDG
jgi:hypothetical protein